MGRTPTGHRKRDLKRLSPRHDEILERLVRGKKPKDIARDRTASTTKKDGE